MPMGNTIWLSCLMYPNIGQNILLELLVNGKPSTPITNLIVLQEKYLSMYFFIPFEIPKW